MSEFIYKTERKESQKGQRKPPMFVSGQLPAEQQGETLGFNLSGEWTSNTNRMVCKRVSADEREAFFVKFAVEGPDRGHMLNPYSIYFREGDDVRIEARRGSMRYEFKRVTKEAFELYLKFLKTKTTSYRTAAERLALNG